MAMTASTLAVMQATRHAAEQLGATRLEPAHLLVGLLATECVPQRVLAGFGLTETKVVSHLRAITTVPATPGGELINSEAMQRLLLDAVRSAKAADEELDPTRLARALLSEPDGTVTSIISAADATPAQMLSALDTVAPVISSGDPVPAGVSRGAPTQAPAGSTGPTLPAALTAFGTDLVASAREGKLSPVYGRERELDRVATILARRTKNNPVLVGAAGVGKTAVVEALAARIASGQVPAELADRPLVSLDISSLVAGASARGDFEARMKQMLASAAANRAIVFIDEIHQIVGAGTRSGGLDVANMLKEQTARGQLSLIGATTDDEYRKHIAPDKALERRLDVVRVEAPTVAQTVDILRAVRPGLVKHHQVKFTDAALHAAAKLTDRHVHDRQLPDKAIDALDEAGAAAALAIARAGHPVVTLYRARADVRRQIANLVTAEKYEDAIPLAAKDAQFTDQILTTTGTDLGLVDVAQVATTVAATAGVPVAQMVTEQHEQLTDLASRLRARVIGQDDAVDLVAATVRRRAVLGSERPAGLLFAGPTGVGKTELASVLAEETGMHLLRFDMSEYAEKHTVSRLVGAPPGYVGHEAGGLLTEAVHRHPHAVVLLDEIEKAHPDVFDLLLQVLEDGRLTDSAGRVVSFADTIVILTSNLGSGQVARTPLGFTSGDTASTHERLSAQVRTAIGQHLRPELVNRLEHVVVFHQLTRADLDQIVATLLARPLAAMAAKGVRVELTASAMDELLAVGYDPTMGARPLRRAITSLVEDPLADALIAGQLPAGTHAVLDLAGPGKLAVRVLEAVAAA